MKNKPEKMMILMMMQLHFAQQCYLSDQLGLMLLRIFNFHGFSNQLNFPDTQFFVCGFNYCAFLPATVGAFITWR